MRVPVAVWQPCELLYTCYLPLLLLRLLRRRRAAVLLHAVDDRHSSPVCCHHRRRRRGQFDSCRGDRDAFQTQAHLFQQTPEMS